MKINPSKTIRNLTLFCIIALSIGWLGVWIDEKLPIQDGDETLGMAIWLVTPLLLVVLLRTFFGDGWKDAGLKPNFKDKKKWYFVSFLIFPFVTLIILTIGKITGWIAFSNFDLQGYKNVFIGLFFVNLIKNIFEESVWRGYLTSKLLKITSNDLIIYLVAGLVWGWWHAPYYLYFLPEETINMVLPVNRYIFMGIAILNMLVWTVMFTEIFRLTQSIWPVILLHTMEDALINHLVIDGYIQFGHHKAIWISPICGIIPSFLYFLMGIWLRKERLNKRNRGS